MAHGGGTDDQVHDVVVVGAGPTGLTLAAELALGGAGVLVLERRATQDVDGSRAGGLHARTIEVLDQRGVAERFLAEGTAMQIIGFAGAAIDMAGFPTRYPYGLALWQRHIERLLGEWAAELGVPVRREVVVVGLDQDDDGVDVRLADGGTVRARYVVGCDGGRSAVRAAAGIAFPGEPASTSWVIAEAHTDRPPQVGPRPEGGGVGPVDPQGAPDGPFRFVLTEPLAEHGGEVTVQDLRDALVAAYGTDFGVHEPTWLSRFTDATRQAAAYRDRRVLLAGDAAHVHPPQGGQGLNTGVQDAVNLGWKLAQVLTGASPDDLLDTYHAERHPVGAQVLRGTMAQVALSGADARHAALRETLADLVVLDEPRRRIAGRQSGLDLRYDLPGDLDGAHPMLGRRVPDLDLRTTDGGTRVFALLHPARPLLLVLGAAPDAAVPALPSRVRVVRADAVAAVELPVVGAVEVPVAVLVRPDGYVAFAGDLDDPALPAAVTTWCGTAA